MHPTEIAHLGSRNIAECFDVSHVRPKLIGTGLDHTNSLTMLAHSTTSLCWRTVLLHCTVSLYYFTILSHCAAHYHLVHIQHKKFVEILLVACLVVPATPGIQLLMNQRRCGVEPRM